MYTYPAFKSTPGLSIATTFTLISCNGTSCFKEPVEGSLWVLSEKEMHAYHIAGQAGHRWSLVSSVFVIILNLYLYRLEHVGVHKYTNTESLLQWVGLPVHQTKEEVTLEQNNNWNKERQRQKYSSNGKLKCILLEPGAHDVKFSLCVSWPRGRSSAGGMLWKHTAPRLRR